MYVVVIGVPFRRIDLDRCQVAADWGKSLLLLRDSLRGEFGPLLVAAPELKDTGGTIGSQMSLEVSAASDQIGFCSLGSAHWRARDFWKNFRSVWKACDEAVSRAAVVHAGINNLYQPFSLAGFCAGIRAKKTTVFVIDGDAVTRSMHLAEGKPLIERLRSKLYRCVLERVQRRAVRAADLSLLKGDLLIDRYSRYAKNPKKFYDTSYSLESVIAAGELDRKVSETHRPMRVLSLGRLVDIKNTDHVVVAFAEASKRGLDATLDIIGGGPEQPRLEALISQHGLEDRVRLLGVKPYDDALLREVSKYDLMVFASTSEETPRSLFDAMAGGCALLCYDIPFTREIIGFARCGVLAERGSIVSLTDGLLELGTNRDRLGAAAVSAREFALQHSSDQWYARRAQLTADAHALRLRDQ